MKFTVTTNPKLARGEKRIQFKQKNEAKKLFSHNTISARLSEKGSW